MSQSEELRSLRRPLMIICADKQVVRHLTADLLWASSLGLLRVGFDGGGGGSSSSSKRQPPICFVPGEQLPPDELI